jgi:hypothetical protein
LSKQTWRQAAKKRAATRQYYWQAFIRNPTFEKFRQENIEEAREYVAWLKKYEAENNLPEALRGPYDPEYRVQYNFLLLPKGETLARRLKLYPPPRLPVWPLKLQDKALTLEINLTHSKNEVLTALDFELRRNRRRVLGKSRVRTSPQGLPILNQHQEQRQEGIFLILKVNLQHKEKEIVAAVKDLLPRSRATGPRLKLKRKVDPWKAWEAVKQEKAFRKAAWRLGVRETTLKEAFYQAFEMVMGRTYQKDHPAKIPPPEVDCRQCPKWPTCNTLCAPALAFVNQDYTSRREPLTTRHN